MTQWKQEVITAALSCASGGLLLLLTWFVGQRLTFRWNVRQKRREMQILALQQFYVAYGEFFAVWKLWNRIDRGVSQFDERRWELHKRAAAAEAIVEGTMVKVASELALSDEQIDALGRFRQAFQLLRESIRQDCILPWTQAEAPEYVAFKVLAVEVCALLSRESPAHLVTTDRAARQLRAITSNRWHDNWFEPQ